MVVFCHPYEELSGRAFQLNNVISMSMGIEYGLNAICHHRDILTYQKAKKQKSFRNKKWTRGGSTQGIRVVTCRVVTL